MKKLIKKIVCVGLVGLFVLGSVGVAEAKVIQGTKGRTFVTLDKIEIQENKMVLEECFNITSYKTIINKKRDSYTVIFRSNKGCKDTKKLVKSVAKKIHGSDTIEKEHKFFRTYKVIVKAKDKKGHMHTCIINGHKVK